MAIGLVLAVLAALWLSSDARAARRADDAAWARWKLTEPAAYSFDWAYCSGMCVNCLLHVTVSDGRVTDAVARDGQCSTAARDAPTIDDIFVMEKRDRSSGTTDSFEIRYDPTWGFPRSVDIRCPDGWSDCGTGYSVSNFQTHP